MDSLFDTIAGLPVHPLVVHAVVILLPLSAIGLIACVLRPAWRERFGILVVLGALAGSVAAWVAEESGEQLAARVGKPAEHAEWGERLVPVAFGYAVVTLIWYAAQRRSRSGTGVGRIFGIVGALLGVAVMVLTTLVGHTGAKAAWADTVTATGGATTPASSTTSAGAASSSSSSSSSASSSASSTSAALTLAVIATHNTQTDCWAAVNGKAYDLTDWIAQHPGGAEAITGLCGTDASSAFAAQHGSQSEPNERLAQFLLGDLTS